MGYGREKNQKGEYLLTRAIVIALQHLGGSGTKKQILNELPNVTDQLSSEIINSEKISKKTGKAYKPFNFDFNFSISALRFAELIFVQGKSKYDRLGGNKTFLLTESATKKDVRVDEEASLFNQEEQAMVDEGWRHNIERNHLKKEIPQTFNQENIDVFDQEKALESSSNSDEQLDEELLSLIQNFSPIKFERFSRRLFTNAMHITFDSRLGVNASKDGGIDGYGYFTSDDFRTSRVSIQSKRYQTSNLVNVGAINEFRGAMSRFGSEYGIFITTSDFSDDAKKAALIDTNALPITLINGDDLIQLIKDNQFEINPITSYEIGDYYYQQD